MTLGPLMVDVAGSELTAEDRACCVTRWWARSSCSRATSATPEQLARSSQRSVRVRTPPLLVTVDHEGGRVQRFRRASRCCRRSARSVTPTTSIRKPGAAGLAVRLAAGRRAARDRHRPELRAVRRSRLRRQRGHRRPRLPPRPGNRRASRRSPACRACARPAWRRRRSISRVTAPSSPTRTSALPVDRRAFDGAGGRPAALPAADRERAGRVMVAHVLFPEVDEHPASFSRALDPAGIALEPRFHGAVFSDDLSMGGAAVRGHRPRARQARAGGRLRRARRSATTGRPCSPRSTQLADAADPLSQVRLAAHARPARPDARAAARRPALARVSRAPSTSAAPPPHSNSTPDDDSREPIWTESTTAVTLPTCSGTRSTACSSSKVPMRKARVIYAQCDAGRDDAPCRRLARAAHADELEQEPRRRTLHASAGAGLRIRLRAADGTRDRMRSLGVRAAAWAHGALLSLRP